MIFAFQSHPPSPTHVPMIVEKAHSESQATLDCHSNPLYRAFGEENGQLPLERDNLRLLVAAVLVVAVARRVGVARGLILYVVALNERRRKDLLVVAITEAGVQNYVRHQLHPVQDSAALLARH